MPTTLNPFSLRLVVLLASVVVATAFAEPRWPNGATAAVSLSYDDSLPVHHLHVAPLLEQHGLRGTFYLSMWNLAEPEAWKAVAAKGHELGNHSLFHPCRRHPGNAAWLSADYDLGAYSPKRFRDELALANKMIDLLDGGKPRSYGNNCTDLTIGRGAEETPMDPILAELFVAGRGNITSTPVDPARPVFTRLGHYNGDSKTFAQMRAEIEAAREKGGWIIYMFHGVGPGTHNLFVADEEHRQLLEWLAQERATLWTAPVAEVAQHLKATSAKR